MAKTLHQGEAVLGVIGASAELEHSEYPPTRGDYFRMCQRANTTNTAGRIEIATGAYLYGNRAFRGSRAFDNCFENGDGDAVVAELTRRADRDPRLFRAIAEDFGGTFPASWRAEAEKEAVQAAAQQELAL